MEWTEEQEEKYGGVRRTKILNYTAREQYFNFVQRLVQGNFLVIILLVVVQ